MKTNPPKPVRPKQKQTQPGVESKMKPKPKSEGKPATGKKKLENKVAIITGGDSGIGRAVAILFAKEGADVAIVYLSEHKDAKETKKLVEAEGAKCLLIPGDVGSEKFCKEAIDKAVKEFKKLDILINNAAEQHPKESITEITSAQLEKTFRTNIFSFFYMTKAALKHLKKGSVIINTSSVTAYRGHVKLIDYASTKGAIVAFTRSLALQLAKKKIRVNGVAPGPIWTPLIPSTFPEEKVEKFGSDTPLGRAGEPEEVAPCYLFLACDDSSYITGQFLHPNGGEIINT